MASSMVVPVNSAKSNILELKGLLEKYKAMPPLILGILQQLEQDKMITYVILKETGIGKTVNGFRKFDGDVGELAKKLISKWKDLASETINSQNSKESSSGGQQSKDSSSINKKLSERYNTTTETQEVKKIKAEKPDPDSLKQDIATNNFSLKHELETSKSKAFIEASKIKKERLTSPAPAITTGSSTSTKIAKVKKEKVDKSAAPSGNNIPTTADCPGVKRENVDDSSKSSSQTETVPTIQNLVKVKKEKSDNSHTKSTKTVPEFSEENEEVKDKPCTLAVSCSGKSSVSKPDTSSESFADALLGKPKKKHKKSKSKQSSENTKSEPDNKSKSTAPKRRSLDGIDLSSGDISPDNGEDLAKLHESVSFSNLVYEPTPIKPKTVYEPTPIKPQTVYEPTPIKPQTVTEHASKKLKTDDKDKNKKTIALSEYKLLSSIKKEKPESNSANEKGLDKKLESDKSMVTKRHAENDSSLLEIGAPQPKVSKLGGLEDIGDDDSGLSLSQLQSNLDHFMDVVESKKNASLQSAPASKNDKLHKLPNSESSSKSSVLSPEHDKKGLKTSSLVPKAYQTHTNSDSESRVSSKYDIRHRSSHSSSDKHKNSDAYKSSKDSTRESSDRHHLNSSVEKHRSDEKKSDHSREKSSSKHKSSHRDDYDRHESSQRSKSHKHSKIRESSPIEDSKKRDSRYNDEYSSKHKSRRQESRKGSSSYHEDKESLRSSSDRLKSKKSHRHESGSSSGSSSRHSHSSSEKLKDRHRSEVDSSSRETSRKDFEEKYKSSSSKDRHNRSSSSHSHRSSDKKSKHKSSSHTSHLESHKSSNESRDDKKHKHSKDKSRKRKTSEGGVDGADGQSFEALMTSSYKEVPKKKKPQSLEQKIAKTVAEKPLPQSYLDDLPELMTDYKPLPKVDLSAGSRHEKQAESTSALAFSDIKASSRAESIYSGKRRGYTTMLSLADLCLHILGNNIDDIGYVGGVPYYLLEPVLKKATPRQLLTIEDYNTDFTQDSDPLWKEHCSRDFKGQKPDEFESWRELYLRKYEEREKKLEMLQSKISAKEQLKSSEARKSQVAYAMASAPKPPREVRRQQAKYGTGSGSMESTARAAAIQKQEQSLRPYVSKGGGGPREPKIAAAVKVISIPPLMKKAKKFFHKLQR